MTPLPTLKSPRLFLRPFTLADGPAVQFLAGHEKVASTTARIPYPYPDGAAEEWISTHGPEWDSREGASFAVALRENSALVGAISLMDWTGDAAEVGYWIGVEYWGQGLATEACVRLKDFAHRELGINRLYAHHLAMNPASGRVLIKAGFTHSASGMASDNSRLAGQPIEQYEALRRLDPGYSCAGLLETNQRLHQNLVGLLEHCRGFNTDELNQELQGFGYPSIRLQIHHSLGAMRYWLGVLEERIDVEDDQVDFPDVASLEAWRQELEKTAAEYLQKTNPADLNTARVCLTWGGRQRALIPATVYLRTVMHHYQHQGQITAMCRLLGRPVNGLDFPLWGSP